MNIIDIIIKKRDGKTLSKEEIDFFIKGVTNGSIADYQTSSMLMAIFINGLNTEETRNLTNSMTNSGEIYDLSAVKGVKVDKHSTGGVADTTTLILAPLVASLGAPVIKMSGRGLGFSGGTIDKLESIPDFNVNISKNDAIRFANKSGIVIMGQSENLTPADKKLYSLRDVTGTVDSLPLIVSSIMSKKIAAGADAVVLDVKCGNGAFMKDYKSARELAVQMAEIGKSVGKKVTAVISSMEQPLGQNIGNSLEVIEAIETLKGNVKGDLLEVVLTLGAYMLINAQKADNEETARQMLLENISNNKGLLKFKELVSQQGGNADITENYNIFGTCPYSYEVKSAYSGFISGMDTAQIGRASVETGAGRAKKTDSIDYCAGIILNVRIGDKVNKGDILATVYSSDEARCRSASNTVAEALKISDEKPETPKLILDIIR